MKMKEKISDSINLRDVITDVIRYMDENDHIKSVDQPILKGELKEGSECVIRIIAERK